VAVASPLPSTMDMGGCPVDGKRFGTRGVLLTSDSSDSDEDRSATSGGTRPSTGSAGGTTAAGTAPAGVA
jgi:hypothetical protein